MHFLSGILREYESRLKVGIFCLKQANTVTDYESILYQIEKHKMLCYPILSAEINDFRVARTLFMDTKIHSVL